MINIMWLALVAFAAVATDAFPYYDPMEDPMEDSMEDSMEDPMENPDLFQGDIILTDRDRNAVATKDLLWPRGIVPYVIDRSLTLNTWRIRSAMNQIESSTCVKFVPRQNEHDYIKIFSGKGCNSIVGYYADEMEGGQPISLSKPRCMHAGIILHELIHALGFHHEQSRSDRDDYLTILWENIQEGHEHNFILLPPTENKLLTPFDYTSVMLYGEYVFSKDKKNLRTMVPKQAGVQLKQPKERPFLGPGDIKRINMLYECPQR